MVLSGKVDADISWLYNSECCLSPDHCFQERICVSTTRNCRACVTLTPSACALRPGAFRPCVLTPGVGAGCGLGAGVVSTCVFPELCRLQDERTLPRLPTLPLRSPPAEHISGYYQRAG